MKMLKKITIADLNNLKPAQIKELVESAGGEVFIGRFIGIVRTSEPVNSPHGISHKFKGEFRAWDINGEEAVSPVAYLPSPFDELLLSQIEEIQGEDKAKKVNVEFGLDVFAVPHGGATGYKFICRPLLEAAPSDPLAALAKSFQPLSLSAPSTPALTDQSAEASVEEKTEAPAAKASKK